MSTQKSIEEIFTEFESLFGNSFTPQHDYDVFGDEVRQWLRTTLQSERDRAEEEKNALIRKYEQGMQ